MGVWKYEYLHALTRKDIEKMADKGYSCGCEGRGKRFFVCTYHEGFDDAAERFAPHITETSLDRFRSLEARLSQLHHRYSVADGDVHCIHDKYPWPCPTVRIVDGIDS